MTVLGDQAGPGFEDAARVEFFLAKPMAAGLDLGHVQDIVDDLEQVMTAAMDVLDITYVLLVAQRSQKLFFHNFGKADHRVQGCAQFMAHVLNEPGLGLARLLGLPAQALGLLLAFRNDIAGPPKVVVLAVDVVANHDRDDEGHEHDGDLHDRLEVKLRVIPILQTDDQVGEAG